MNARPAGYLVALALLSWLLMQAVHELGHVAAALATGGSVERVVLHPLTDDRRILPLERTGEVLEAPVGFMLVVSYNPGYQNLLKALKPSTRQRFVAIEFDFLPNAAEIAVVAAESGLDEARVAPLVALAHRLRALKGHDLEEGVSTRLLVYCACLIDSGMGVREAVRAAMIEPLTDEPDVRAALLEIADAMIR